MDNRPYYHKLYADLIRDKYPGKEKDCSAYLQKENWTALDVIHINELLFGVKKKEHQSIDKKHRSYDLESIEQILLYQQNNMLNNNQVANKYGLSRNTISKWRRLFAKRCEAEQDKSI